MKVKAFLARAAKYVLYPLFYLGCLVFFLYLTFPWGALKNKLIADFAKSQEKKGEKAWRLEIESLSGYWFSGVELEGVKITMPASDDEDEAAKKLARSQGADEMADPPDGSGPAEPAADKKEAEKKPDSVMVITSARARARLLPLLVGTVKIDFDAEAFGGEVSGTIPIGGGTLAIDVKDVDFAQVAPLRDLVGLPVKGVANGHVEFTSDNNGKWAKANGGLDITVADVVLGDGKAKLLGKATLPPAKIGTLEISGKATNGVFTFDKFGASGKDVELIGNGFLKLRDQWDASQLDFIIRFSFSDAFRVSDPKVTALLGDPNPDPNDIQLPPGIELDKRIKKGKREDGFYGLRGKGALKRLKWDGTTDDAPAKPAPSAADADSSAPSAVAAAPTTAPKKPVKKPTKTTSPTPPEPKAPTPAPTPEPVAPTPAPTPAPEPKQFPTAPLPEQPAPTPNPDQNQPAPPQEDPAPPPPQ